MANPLDVQCKRTDNEIQATLNQIIDTTKALSSHQGQVGPAPKNCHSLVATANLKLVVFTKEGFKISKKAIEIWQRVHQSRVDIIVQSTSL